MSSITAIFSDEGQLVWNDGVVAGDPAWLSFVDRPPVEMAPLTPEGPSLPLADARRDPWCFVALVRELESGVRLRMRGEFPLLPDPPPRALR